MALIYLKLHTEYNKCILILIIINGIHVNHCQDNDVYGK